MDSRSCSPESEIACSANDISDSDMYDFSSSDEEEEHNQNGATNQVASGKKKHIKVPGIVYIGGLPSAVASPSWLRSCFCAFASIGRVHLQPEDATEQTLKGWIEFCRRQLAISIAEGFNNTPIYCLKDTEYEGVQYRMEYLPGITWDQVMENLELNKSQLDETQDSSSSRYDDSTNKNRML